MENYDDDNISSTSQIVSIIIGVLSASVAIIYTITSLPEGIQEYSKVVESLSVLGCAAIAIITGFLMYLISLLITNISSISRKMERIKDRMSNIFNNTYKFR